jgi:hypothetical protein
VRSVWRTDDGALLRQPPRGATGVHLPARWHRTARPICQRIIGGALDHAIGELLIETVSPLALEVTLAVQEELEARAQEVDRMRRQQVEHARYEAELAQRRYLRVDPDNRLVADSLEAEWNNKLRALAAAQEDYERQCASAGSLLSADQRRQVMMLVTDFPRLWREPATPQRERKRMVRLLLEDVTLLRADEVVAQVRFRGGATHTLRLPLPIPAPELRKTPSTVVAEIDHLIERAHRCRDRRHPERPRAAARQKYCDQICSMKAYAGRKTAGLVRTRRSTLKPGLDVLSHG